MPELIKTSAREAVRLLKAREISPLELIDAALARIAEVEPKVNALPTLVPERARAQAEAIMADTTTARAHVGWLGGLPIAVKDLTEVKGVRTTWGSPIYKDHISTSNDAAVDILESRGAVVLAKSNTPEFGAGANTFNEVFGKTRNPWDTRMNCGGSSGGSAVALATGEVWLATGTDLGGSLRTPASFCSVVGLRPSPGRVARSTGNPYDSMSVQGPMARDVADLALFMDALCGRHAADPFSWEAPASPFQRAAQASALPKRVAFSTDLGFLPVERETKELIRAAADKLAAAGVIVEEAHPDLREARDIFLTIRSGAYAARYGELYRSQKDKLKPEVQWNIEHGLTLDAATVGRAELARGRIIQRAAKFFQTYDLLLCPAAACAPREVELRWVDEIEGTKLESYLDWIAITFATTLTGCPAISLPCAFTRSGLPIGLQMVAPNGHEAALLSAAAAAENIFDVAKLLPIDPRS